MSGRRTLRLLPPPSLAVIYGRAATLEQLALRYGLQGHDRRREIGLDLAERVERIADRLAA